MSKIESKKTREELLTELLGDQEQKHQAACELLRNLKANRDKIHSLLQHFVSEEPDLVYRFYHQSFKVFYMTPLIEQADILFKRLAPDSAELNAWYRLITNTALSKKFESETNQKWIGETTTLLLAFWNAKYFLEQMLVAADELSEPPQLMPSGWAAVLYLYDLR